MFFNWSGFSEAYPTDKTAAFLINETGVKQLGWKSPSVALALPRRWRGWWAMPKWLAGFAYKISISWRVC